MSLARLTQAGNSHLLFICGRSVVVVMSLSFSVMVFSEMLVVSVGVIFDGVVVVVMVVSVLFFVVVSSVVLVVSLVGLVSGGEEG